MKESIRAWLTGQFGPDEELFQELYGQYAADMKKLAEELNSLLASGDAATIGERGHAMKGMALQIGDSDLSEPCKALQDAGRAGNLVDCTALIPRILSAVAEL